MEATLNYDAAVIGAGPTGLAAAEDLKAAGKSVVVIEKYLWGGTCPNYGCDPKKLLLAGVEARENALAFQNDGLIADVTLDWPKLMARKAKFTDTMPGRTLGSLDTAQIDHLYGQAEFLDEETLLVHEKTGNVVVRANDYVIAVGQRPADLPIEGGELTTDSEQFLSLPEMPKDVVIIGGGYIAVEFASIAVATGANVHLVVRGDEILKDFESDFADELMEQLSDRGVHVYFNTTVTAVRKTDAGLSAELSFGSTIPAGLVVRAVGRTPNSDLLALDKAGVESNQHGIIVDEYLRTSNPHIYAGGDVANTPVPRLTTTGYFEGRYIAKVLNGHEAAIKYPLIPITVFGTPKIAEVGVAPSAAEMLDYEVRTFDMTEWFSYYRAAESKVASKIVFNQAGEIVGAAMIGNHAEELINYFVDAIERKDTYEAVRERLYSYPSLASDLEYFF